VSESFVRLCTIVGAIIIVAICSVVLMFFLVGLWSIIREGKRVLEKRKAFGGIKDVGQIR